MRLIASISGGKDSTAMLLFLIEQGIEFEPVFMDTGWESDTTYEYLEHLENKLNIEIRRISNSLQMVELIIKKAMFPSRRIRFCTQQLKIFPFLNYIGEEKVTNCVGIRAAESRQRAQLQERDLMQDADNVEVWRPLIKWSIDDVINIHSRHDLKPNPLYLRGAARVGCWPCVFERKSDIKLLAELSPERVDLIRELERVVQKRQLARLKARGETYESMGWHPPTWFSLKLNGNRKSTHVPIDDVISWSRTSFGGKQLMLDNIDEKRGCIRWGLCDAY
jgi:3'-phosphoadenosine 5'-phosphosulfate sulfotransferase (PAPS reductase)/FAD synthetase